MTRKPPPIVKSFLVCRDILHNSYNGEYLLFAPFDGLNLPAFPANVRLCLFIKVTGGHGSYQLALQLRDDTDTVLGELTGPEAVHSADPLAPYQISWRDLGLGFPRPGRYHLVLLADGEEIAQHALHLQLAAKA